MRRFACDSYLLLVKTPQLIGFTLRHCSLAVIAVLLTGSTISQSKSSSPVIVSKVSKRHKVV